MRAIKIETNGSVHVVNIPRNFSAVRDAVGGVLDTIRLFSDVVTYIKRSPGENERFNKKVHGVKGPVLITGGQGSYLEDLTEKQVKDITLMFGGA